MGWNIKRILARIFPVSVYILWMLATQVFAAEDMWQVANRRIWIAWAIINGIGAFLAYVRPLLAGLNTIE